MDYTKKHTFALLALWFMAPFMKNVDLKKEGLTDEEINFVKGYIKTGVIIWVVLAVAIIASIFLSRSSLPFKDIVMFLIWAIPVLLLIFGTFNILNDKALHLKLKTTQEMMQKFNNPIKQDIGPIKFFYYYLPIYNIYLWYTQKNNPKVYRRVKESIIFNIFILLLPTSFLTFIAIVAYITRVAFLIGGKDLIPDEIKQKLDNLFETNPEEIWGYVKGAILYVFNANKTGQLNKYIAQAKREYVYLGNSLEKKLLVEYVITFLLLLPGLISPYTFLYSLWWIGRYAIAINLKKIPYIPLIHEIVDFLYSLAFQKNAKSKAND